MLKEKNLIWIGIFTIAMAYLESAVVVYLRAIYKIEDLLRDINLTPDKYTFIEIGREAATIVMLIFIALFAGSKWSKKIGYFFFSFGIWDIFYYIWLYIFIGWPKSFFEWDILFLIPLPWWGPVITPILISLLLISIGYLLINDFKFRIMLIDWIILGVAILLILYTFMEDSVKVILSGTGDILKIKPTNFNWTIFLLALVTWVITTFRVFYTAIKK